MRTPEQIANILHNRLIDDYAKNFTIDDVISILTNAPTMHKDAFMDHLYNNRPEDALKPIIKEFHRRASAMALAEAHRIVGAGYISIEDLDKLIDS